MKFTPSEKIYNRLVSGLSSDIDLEDIEIFCNSIDSEEIEDRVFAVFFTGWSNINEKIKMYKRIAELLVESEFDASNL